MTLFSYEQQTTGRQNKSETGLCGDVKTVRFQTFVHPIGHKERRKKEAGFTSCMPGGSSPLCAAATPPPPPYAPPCDRQPPLLPRGKLDTSPHTTVLAWHSGKISRPTELLTDFYPRYPAWDLWTFLISTVRCLCKHIIVVIRRLIK